MRRCPIPRRSRPWKRAPPTSRAQQAPELVWLLEHPPLYTSGTSGKAADLLDPRFPMFATGRGGQLTYHGPGQRVAYVMLDLKRRRPDVRAYVAGLEQWIIRTLAAFNVRGERREDRVGVWVKRPDKGEGFEDKIAAIGVRLKRWVSFHGISINVEPDLTHFDAIVPCGVADPRYGVTSLADLGHARDHGRCRYRAPAGVRRRCSAPCSRGCRKRRSEPRSGRRRLGAERVEAANEDIDRHGIVPVVIFRFEERRLLSFSPSADGLIVDPRSRAQLGSASRGACRRLRRVRDRMAGPEDANGEPRA